MLTPFAPDVWIDTRSAKFWGVECQSRMTVIRMRGGGLFVHSPVGLDEVTRREVEALGDVRAVVAPSIFHHLHVAPWMKAYPQAVFAACPGLEWKRPDLAFSEVLGDRPHPLWAGELEQVYFSSRRENEVVFYLPRQKLMICADALLNVSTIDVPLTKLVAWLMKNDAPGKGRLEPWMIRDRGLARRQVDRILAWDFDQAILSHGEPVRARAHDVMREAYSWL